MADQTRVVSTSANLTTFPVHKENPLAPTRSPRHDNHVTSTAGTLATLTMTLPTPPVTAWINVRILHGVFMAMLARTGQIATSVATLLLKCGPTAVTRSIVIFIVNTIKRHAVWALSHISKKIGKDSPTDTDTDPSASVPTPFITLGIRATLNHIGP